MTETMAALGAPKGEEGGLAAALPEWEPFPEVRASLEEARSRGWKLALLSNTDRDFIEASIARIGVPFELAIVASEIDSYKPATGTGCSSSRRRALRVTRTCTSRKPLPRHRSRRTSSVCSRSGSIATASSTSRPRPASSPICPRFPTLSMSLSLPDGFSVRAATREDAPAINELVVAADEAVQGWSRFDRGRPARLVAARRPRAGLLGCGAGRPGRGLQRSVRTWQRTRSWTASSIPRRRARARGVAACERRGTRPRTRAPGRPHVVPCADDAARRLFEQRGFREVRRYYRMLIELDAPPPAPAWPEGFRIGTFEPDDALLSMLQ